MLNQAIQVHHNLLALPMCYIPVRFYPVLNVSIFSVPSLQLHLKSGKTGRPDEVLKALALDELAAHIHRTAIILADDGAAVGEY